MHCSRLFVKLAFLRCDIIIKVDYRCPKESDFSSSQRQSLKCSYAPDPDLSSWKKENITHKQTNKKHSSMHSTASSQIPYLEFRECRCNQFTRGKGRSISMVNAPPISIGVKHEETFSPEYVTEGQKKPIICTHLWSDIQFQPYTITSLHTQCTLPKMLLLLTSKTQKNLPSNFLSPYFSALKKS